MKELIELKSIFLNIIYNLISQNHKNSVLNGRAEGKKNITPTAVYGLLKDFSVSISLRNQLQQT